MIELKATIVVAATFFSLVVATGVGVFTTSMIAVALAGG